MDVLGYADRPSVAPGEVIRFMVSCAAETYEARVVRLVHGDDNPAGPGVKEEEVATAVTGERPGRRQELRHGSYVLVPDRPALRLEGSLTVQAWIYPTRPGPGPQAILARRRAAGGPGYALVLDERGALALWLGDPDGRLEEVTSGVPVTPREWAFVAATFDAERGRVRLVQRPLRAALAGAGAAEREVPVETSTLGDAGAPLLLAASGDPAADGVSCHFNGKIDAPRLWRSALGRPALARLEDGASADDVDAPSLVAAWDFSRDIGSSRVTDASGNGLDGATVNLPTRGVTGRNWTGAELDFRRAPEEYGAIHFHEDDLADAGWEPDFELTVPEGLRSGIYAVRLRAGASEDSVPCGGPGRPAAGPRARSRSSPPP